jgi:hypothetical protein
MLYLVVLFLAILFFTTYWHIQQNRKLTAQWKKHLDTNTARWMEQFAWSRTAQLLLAIAGGLFALLLLNHFQETQHNQHLVAMNQAMDARLEQLTTLQQTMAAIDTRLNVPDTHKTSQERMGEVGVRAQAVPSTPSARATDMITDDALGARIEAQAQPITPPVSLQDIYNPENDASDIPSEIDAIKKRYEGLLVNYLFLNKCELIDTRDYHTIISALAREMASVNAPGRLEHDITTAAEGSYREMYAQSSCDGPEIKQLHDQYSSYIQTISTNVLSVK